MATPPASRVNRDRLAGPLQLPLAFDELLSTLDLGH